MEDLRVGDLVEMTGYNEYWDGFVCRVLEFSNSGDEAMLIVEQPSSEGLWKKGDIIGSWNRKFLSRVIEEGGTEDRLKERLKSLKEEIERVKIALEVVRDLG